MKKLTFPAALCITFFLTSLFSQAQQFDFGVGASTVLAPATTTNSSGIYSQTIGGGTFINFGGDVLIRHNFGIDIDGAVRASQSQYSIQQASGFYEPFRPVFYDFNAIWAPPIGRKLSGELIGGIGVEDIRDYGTANFNNFTGYTPYASLNHFMLDFGGGIRYYFHGNAFIRPEVRVYIVPNQNNVNNISPSGTADFVFSGTYAARVGATLGYSFGRGWR
jgi:hypothetical protein